MPSPAYPFASRSRSRGESLLGGGGLPEEAFGTLLYLFDTSVASSIIEEGTGVSQWNDISGNELNVFQTTDANRPSLTTDAGNPALLFNGTSDFLFDIFGAGVFSAQQTMFCVARKLDDLATYTVIETNSNAAGRRSNNAFFIGAVVAEHFSDASSSQIILPNSDTNIHAWTSRHQDGGPGVGELDDGTTNDDTNVGNLTANYQQINIGRRQNGTEFMNGYIMEAGAYQERLDDTTNTGLLDFLKTKWSV